MSITHPLLTPAYQRGLVQNLWNFVKLLYLIRILSRFEKVDFLPQEKIMQSLSKNLKFMKIMFYIILISQYQNNFQREPFKISFMS